MRSASPKSKDTEYTEGLEPGANADVLISTESHMHDHTLTRYGRCATKSFCLRLLQVLSLSRRRTQDPCIKLREVCDTLVRIFWPKVSGRDGEDLASPANCAFTSLSGGN